MTGHVHLLAGAYALDALPAEECAFFERHLETCPPCRHAVMGYRETAAALGMAAAHVPPPALRVRVVAEVAAARQTVPSRGHRRPLRERLRSHLAAVAGVLAVVLVSVGGAVDSLSESRQGPAGGVIAPEFVAGAETVRMDAPDGVDARFLFSAADDEGYLVVTGLQALGPDRDYQLWLFHDGAPVPAGVFDVAAGRTAVPVDAPVRGAEMIAVTTEPAGGLRQPSGAVLLSAPLDSGDQGVGPRPTPSGV